MARRARGGRGEARRSQALGTFHAMCVGAMLLIGIAMIANHAATPPSIATAGDPPVTAVAPNVDVACMTTHPARLEAGARTPWHAIAGDKTLIVTDGRAVVQPRGEQPITIEAGASIIMSANDWLWYGASPEGPAAITIVSACA